MRTVRFPRFLPWDWCLGVDTSGVQRVRAKRTVEGGVVGGAEAVGLVVFVPSFEEADLIGVGDP